MEIFIFHQFLINVKTSCVKISPHCPPICNIVFNCLSVYLHYTRFLKICNDRDHVQRTAQFFYTSIQQSQRSLLLQFKCRQCSFNSVHKGCCFLRVWVLKFGLLYSSVSGVNFVLNTKGVNSITVTFVSYQTHAFSPSLKLTHIL